MDCLGRYEVLGEIASGGMAKVYLGRVVGEGGFEREVAIKLMHQHIAEDPEFVAMFLDEARLAALIRHPNVVPTVDVQRTAQGTFLVMEFIEGLSLDALLRQQRRKGGTLACDVVVRMLMDALLGLHAAHELTNRDGQPLNLIHRDVSPANILVGTDGISRITDFGVARASARLCSTRGARAKGKLPYMAPEQIMDGTVDRRSDVYAVGVTLWEALTSHRLFRGESEGAVLQKVLAGAPTTPRQENPEVPEPIDAVCMRALAVDAAARFGTASEMAEALEEAARATGLRIASQSRVAAVLNGFETNAVRIAAARKSMPGLRPVEASRGIATPGAGTPISACQTPVVDSTRHLGAPTTASATLISAVARRDEPVRARGRWRRRFALGVAAAVVVSGVLVWAGTRLGSEDQSQPSNQPGGSAWPTTEQGSAPTSTDRSPTASMAARDDAAAAEGAAPAGSASTSGSSMARPYGSNAVTPVGRAPGAATGHAGAKGSSAADFLPGTL